MRFSPLHRASLYLLLAMTALALAARGQTTTRLSVNASGVQGLGNSDYGSITADGRFLVFWSEATNLVPGDSNSRDDIFWADIEAGTIGIASLAWNQALQAYGGSVSQVDQPGISEDGQLVVFSSRASNLVPNDTNNAIDIFVRDISSRTTERVSVGVGGAQITGDHSVAPTITADGRYVVFESGNIGLPGGASGGASIYVHDRLSGTTSRVSWSATGSATNGDDSAPMVSRGGTAVAYQSTSTDIVLGDTNAEQDIFVRDLVTNTSIRASTTSAGVEANNSSFHPSISGDGMRVAFSSLATNLVPLDTNNSQDIFLHDRNTGKTTRISANASGIEANGFSDFPAISPDGRYVAFESDADNLVPGDTNGLRDVFLVDTTTSAVERVSVSSTGAQAVTGWSCAPSASTGAQQVVFSSMANNLVPADTNNRRDMFMRETAPLCVGSTTYCTAGTTASGCQAALASCGSASATATSGFSVIAANVEAARDGLFFFGASGRQAIPWGNGTSLQCVVPPVKRGGLLFGVGTAGACDGTFTQDLNAHWCPTCTRPQHNPGAGAIVQAQLWFRDPWNTSNQSTSMSDALEFTVGP